MDIETSKNDNNLDESYEEDNFEMNSEIIEEKTTPENYSTDEYNNIIDIATPEKKMKLQKKWKYSFIQSNFLRNLYDTNQIVDTLKDYDKLLTDEKVENLTKDNKRLIYFRVIKNH